MVSDIKILFILLVVTSLVSFAQWSNDPHENKNVNSGQLVTMCANKYGEIYVLWNDGPCPRMQLIDSSGHLKWGDGYFVTVDSAKVFGPLGLKSKLLITESGNCFVVWNDSRNYSSPYNRTQSDAMIQAFDRNGNRLMGGNGMKLTDALLPSTGLPIGLVNDSTVRVIVSVNDGVSMNNQISFQDVTISGQPRFVRPGKQLLNNAICLQSEMITNDSFILNSASGSLYKFDGDGNMVWSTTTGFDRHCKMSVSGQNIYLASPSIFSADSSGYQLVLSIYDGSGHYHDDDSLKIFVSDALAEGNIQIVKGSHGDIFIAYSTMKRNTNIIHLNNDVVDVVNSAPMLGYSYFYPNQATVATNNAGGIIVVANDSPIQGQGTGLYCINIGSDNTSVWKNTLSTVTQRVEPTKYEPYMVVSDSLGGIICGWSERGDGGGFGTYLQKINSTGTPGNVLSVRMQGQSISQSNVGLYPNPTNGHIVILFNADHDGAPMTISLYDAIGRLVDTYITNQMIHQGQNRFVFNFSTIHTPSFTSGQYYVSILSEGRRYVSKLLYIK